MQLGVIHQKLKELSHFSKKLRTVAADEKTGITIERSEELVNPQSEVTFKK